MEVCWQLVTGAALDHGALRASRFGATGASAIPASQTGGAPASELPASRPEAVRWLVSRSTAGLIQNNAQLTVTTASWTGLGGFTGNGTPGEGFGSEIVSYTITYRQPFISGVIAESLWGGDSITHRTTIIIMNEPFG